MRISDWSSYVCSSDLQEGLHAQQRRAVARLEALRNQIEQALVVGAADAVVALGGVGEVEQGEALHQPADVAGDLGLEEVEGAGRREEGQRLHRRVRRRQHLQQVRDEDAAGAVSDQVQFRLARHPGQAGRDLSGGERSEEHTSELQSLMRISYAVFCLKKKNTTQCK